MRIGCDLTPPTGGHGWEKLLNGSSAPHRPDFTADFRDDRMPFNRTGMVVPSFRSWRISMTLKEGVFFQSQVLNLQLLVQSRNENTRPRLQTGAQDRNRQEISCPPSWPRRVCC